MSADVVPPDAQGIVRSAACIRTGGVVVYPTETVYGLGVDPHNEAALDRLFAIKGRDPGSPLIVLIRGELDLSALITEVPDRARRLASAFWPGPVTLILPASPHLPDRLTGGSATLAVRHSSSPIAASLLDALGGPLTSTSANRSGCPPARTASQARADLGDDVDLILDGGPSPGSLPTTVVDTTLDPPRVVREGPIENAELQRVLQTRR